MANSDEAKRQPPELKAATGREKRVGLDLRGSLSTRSSPCPPIFAPVTERPLAAPPAVSEGAPQQDVQQTLHELRQVLTVVFGLTELYLDDPAQATATDRELLETHMLQARTLLSRIASLTIDSCSDQPETGAAWN